MTILTKLADAIIVSILWVIGSLPIVTLAAAKNALYETMQICIVRDEGTLLKTFWNAYRRDFLRGILQTLVFEAILLPSLAAVIWGSMYGEGIDWLGAAYVALANICAATVETAVYAFCLVRSTTLTFGRQLAVSFVLAIRHLPTSLLLLAVLIAMGVILDVIAYLAIVLPAGAAWVYGRFLEKINNIRYF